VVGVAVAVTEVPALTVIPPDTVPQLELLLETLSVYCVGAAVPAWVTEMVWVILPPVTVTVAVLELVEVLATVVMLNDPLLLPEAGLTVSHEGAPLDAVQGTLDVTVTVSDVAPACVFHVERSNVSEDGIAS
jgi:hypothetical protein